MQISAERKILIITLYRFLAVYLHYLAKVKIVLKTDKRPYNKWIYLVLGSVFSIKSKA